MISARCRCESIVVVGPAMLEAYPPTTARYDKDNAKLVTMEPSDALRAQQQWQRCRHA